MSQSREQQLNKALKEVKVRLVVARHNVRQSNELLEQKQFELFATQLIDLINQGLEEKK